MKKVLLVDDDPVQLKLNVTRLRDAGFAVVTAANAAEALARARFEPPDVVMSDVLMGEVDGFGLCRQLREDAALATVPVILLSAHYGEEADRDFATRIGATALVTRTPEFDDELQALHACLSGEGQAPPDTPPALYEEHLRTTNNQLTKLLEQAQSAERRYRTLFENANSAISLITLEGEILETNGVFREIVGAPGEDMRGRHISDFAAAGSEAANVAEFRELIASGVGRAEAVPLRRADGRTIYVDFSVRVIDLEGRPVMLSIGHDVTEKILATRHLAEAEEKYRSLVERLPDVIWTVDRAGNMRFITPNCAIVLGFSADEVLGETRAAREDRAHPEDRERLHEAFKRWLDEGVPMDVEYRRRRKDGTYTWVRNRGTARYERDGEVLFDGMLSDVSERRKLDDLVAQAQKMEAIGQLTGGIAHDFNNLLAAILANTHFLLDALVPQDPRWADAEEVRLAAERAASLTRQLLAFSRRQVLEPKVADLNVTVRGLEKMLRRLIGEDIDLTVSAASDLGAVRVDLGQIEQVIVNLVVNARDAMPSGGRMSIETANIELAAGVAAESASPPPGRYVMVAVHDSGCGMDAATRARIFEPFFTTKPPGTSTGLGLSTCYGIIKQSGGYIWVYSEVGVGTVFKVYLPCVDEVPEYAARHAETGTTGSETILVIEDDARVRAVITRIMSARGYRVYAARDGDEAAAAVARSRGEIDLVLSDVIMPGRSGPEVVGDVLARCQGARTLYMSGYTDHAVLRSGTLQQGTAFIQKPFTPEALAKKVRQVLDG